MIHVMMSGKTSEMMRWETEVANIIFIIVGLRLSLSILYLLVEY